ncbi:MAG: hypothetical protein AB2421_17035 [Thermotaleaceae bacterium]
MLKLKMTQELSQAIQLLQYSSNELLEFLLCSNMKKPITLSQMSLLINMGMNL